MAEEQIAPPRRVLGVLGGMGPVSSAEFVASVYGHCTGEREQDFPALVLHSDPGISARTPATMDTRDSAVLARMTAGLTSLLDAGCEDIVMCCMTLHHLLPRVPREIRRHVVSVLDVIVDEIAAAEGRHLMLCSRDSRELRLFERHPRWARAAGHVAFAGIEESRAFQEAIQDVKVNRGPERALEWIGRQLKEQQVTSVVAGCSEIHVLARRWGDRVGAGVLDPFDTLARAAAQGRVDDYRNAEHEGHPA